MDPPLPVQSKVTERRLQVRVQGRMPKGQDIHHMNPDVFQSAECVCVLIFVPSLYGDLICFCRV